MAEQTSSCDHERLRLLLADELPPEIEPETTEHLATCPSCRKQLESLAGNQDWWTELQTCLGENAGLIVSTPVGGLDDLANFPGATGNFDALDDLDDLIPFPTDDLEKYFAEDVGSIKWLSAGHVRRVPPTSRVR